MVQEDIPVTPEDKLIKKLKYSVEDIRNMYRDKINNHTTMFDRGYATKIEVFLKTGYAPWEYLIMSWDDEEEMDFLIDCGLSKEEIENGKF
jgi:hypothetical protein